MGKLSGFRTATNSVVMTVIGKVYGLVTKWAGDLVEMTAVL
jgi:hypothetical protein